MPLCYLYGPVTAAFADNHLRKQRQAGDCLAFDAAGTTDLAILPTDTWENVCARLPSGWRPDFIALNLAYTHAPACLWSAPLPLVGLASDWNLLWHYYRHRLRQCELVLTDTVGVEVLAREGITHALAANLYGCGRSFLAAAETETERDIDILFVGNLHPAVQRERMPWLARLARLSERWKVVIRGGVFGDEYRRLLRRSRIVFNRSGRSEANQRAFEATASGALLFQEAGNRELPELFRDRQECIYYGKDNLEELLDHYLMHEEERQALAEAAHFRTAEFSYEHLWDKHIQFVERQWPTVVERRRERPTPDPVADLLARTWQALGGSWKDDPTLRDDLAAALLQQSQAAILHNALGLLRARK